MNLYAFFAVVNFFTSLILGIFVFASNRKDKINLSFSLFASAVAFWSFGYYFWQVSTSAETALFWCRLLMAGAVFIPFTYLCFVFRFLEIFEQKKRFLLFTFLLFLIFFFLDFTPLFISHV
ncbi:MAG: histidine kinase N-terminal 7TM domain-containing protein, partial [Actinomycetota bacterium]